MIVPMNVQDCLPLIERYFDEAAKSIGERCVAPLDPCALRLFTRSVV
jgi:hypothetical protein